MSEGTELARAATSSITERRRGAFDPGQVDLIRVTVAKDLDSDAELAMFLETCARHELDPFIKEIWAYKKRGRVIIQVSRDGLLGIANRHTPSGKYHTEGDGQFLGCQSDVVYEHDYFEKRHEEREDGTEKVVVDHRYRDEKGEATHGGRDGSGRGSRVGAWARVRRRGHDDVYFFAYGDQYEKSASDGPVWGSHPHAMLQKCAESVALRKAFSVSGVVGEGELAGPRANLTETTGEGSPDIRWPEDDELRANLERMFEALGYRRAKVRLKVNACETPEQFEALVAELNNELDSQMADAEPVQDAEVVAEGEG